MKTNWTTITLLIATVLSGTIPARPAGFANLHSFGLVSAGNTNSDGSAPGASLIAAGSTLYGTTTGGGASGLGTVLALNTDGTGFSTLHSFSSRIDGSGPLAALAESNGTLYGTTRAGGSNGLGTVFAVSTHGTGFVNLHHFGDRLGRETPTARNTNSGGAFPETDLLLSSNMLFGATEQGGTGGNGTLFRMNTDGTGFVLLHHFTNEDGAYPSTHMVLSGTNLFGTTAFGGSASGLGDGVIFRINTDGTGFTNLFKFSGSGAANPQAGLVLSGDILYGTTPNGDGPAAYGTVFRIRTDGTGFTNFYVLDVNLNAGHPSPGLAISGNTLYANQLGFDTFGGTVFQVKTDATGFANLTSFNSPGDPGTLTGLLFFNGNLYGTASSGGANGSGAVFSVGVASASAPLSIRPGGGGAVILSWGDPSLSLYTAAIVTSTFTKVANAASPYTNVMAGTEGFFQVR